MSGVQAPSADPRAMNIINIILPVITMAVTFALYTIVQKKELTASTGALSHAQRYLSADSSLRQYDRL